MVLCWKLGYFVVAFLRRRRRFGPRSGSPRHYHWLFVFWRGGLQFRVFFGVSSSCLIDLLVPFRRYISIMSTHNGGEGFLGEPWRVDAKPFLRHVFKSCDNVESLLRSVIIEFLYIFRGR